MKFRLKDRISDYAIAFLLTGLSLWTLSACDSTQLISGTTNATPTRTPRPTFTAVPDFTDTPTTAPTNTPAPTNTSGPTNTPAPTITATRPAVTVRPANTQSPPPPTKQPLPISFDPSLAPSPGDPMYPCDQEGGFYEVIIYAKTAGARPRPFKAGLTFVILDTAGNLLHDGAGKALVAVTDDSKQSGQAFGSNCRRSGAITSTDLFNGKLEVSDVVRANATDATLIQRFVKSANDLSPLSDDVRLTFPKANARRWWLYFQFQ